MTIDEMFNELEDKVRDTYIVTLKYKYDFEENYTIENHILEYDSIDDSYVWLNDWNEGQTDVEVLGYMILGDVNTTQLLTCEDCISREKTLNKINELIAEYIPLMPTGWTLPLNIAKTINELPSVTPSRPRGKWIKAETEGRFYCSICGGIHNDPESGEWREVFDFKYPYCPNCGADMRESEGEE